MTAPSAPDTGTPVLQVRGIVKTYGGVIALDGVSFDLYPGEVHCLAGENGCGKSTLIKIISGAERPDAGEIVIDWRRTSRNEHHRGDHQRHSGYLPRLLAVRKPHRRREHRPHQRRRRTSQALFTRGRTKDGTGYRRRAAPEPRPRRRRPRRCPSPTGSSPPSAAPSVHQARVIIMDEPTTALTHTEVDRLFALVETLRTRGVGLVFVSHKLDEVLRVAQRVTILRSGRQVVTGPTSDFTRQSISESMTGRKISEERLVSELTAEAAVVLDVEGLGRPGAFEDVSFSVREGEILGVTGLLGLGVPHRDRRSPVRRPPRRERHGHGRRNAGEIAVHPRCHRRGYRLRSRGPPDAGPVHGPRHRRQHHRRIPRSVSNTLGHFGQRQDPQDHSCVVRPPAHQGAPRRGPGPLTLWRQCPTRRPGQWLAIRPRVLILNGPTVGVDVGSKEDILEILREEAADGRSIIIISDDVPELVAACHRVLVIRQGRMSHTLENATTSTSTSSWKGWRREQTRAATLLDTQSSRTEQRGHPRPDPAWPDHRDVAAQPGLLLGIDVVRDRAQLDPRR